MALWTVGVFTMEELGARVLSIDGLKKVKTSQVSQTAMYLYISILGWYATNEFRTAWPQVLLVSSAYPALTLLKTVCN